MSFLDIIFETFRSLTANKARSALTILGIVVGIGSVIALISIGEGTKNEILSQINGIGSNLVTVTNTTGDITDDDVAALKGIKGVSFITPVRQAQTTVSISGASSAVSLTGADATFAKARSIKVTEGSFISAYENRIRARVIVLSPAVVKDLWGDEDYEAVGRQVRVSGKLYEVIGVTDDSSGGIMAAFSGNAAYVPLTTVAADFTGSGSYASLYLSTSNGDDMASVTDLADKLLMNRHGIPEDGTRDFTILSLSSLLDVASRITDMLTYMLAAIASISLIVGGIGIMNMMLTSVTERIREIGLRKAIGATPANITVQFLVESIALTSIGGVLGIILGWIVSLIINNFTSLKMMSCSTY